MSLPTKVNAAAEAQARFVSDFERFQAAGNWCSTAPWLDGLRRQGIAQFADRGFPGVRDEAWKYTSTAPIVKAGLKVVETGRLADAAQASSLLGSLEAHPCWMLSPIRVVFVNGQFSARLSSLDTLPEGVRVSDLATLLKADPSSVSSLLESYAGATDDGLKALNSAFLEQGAVIRIARDRAIASPVHLIFLGDGGGQASFVRNLILAEAGSKATVLETYFGSGEKASPGMINIVTQAAVAPNASLDHVAIQLEAESAYHVGDLRVRQETASHFRSFWFSFGGGLVRNEIQVKLAGREARCELLGLYGARGTQHVDNYTLIEHEVPNCTSREIYKGILDGRARGVFTGKIFVAQDAQKTSSEQSNPNLLLSDDAIATTRPQLQIYADDVKCTHGATVGRIDEDALFYLRTRGIGRPEAQRMLTAAFAAEVVDELPDAPLRMAVLAQLHGWLSPGGGVE